jgi:ferritin-like protein
MSSESLHEAADVLSEETKDLHRANVSLREELEAIDWYQQRAEACTDADLRAVLLHNKNEEIEHAMMLLEWLRRKDAVFAEKFTMYLNVAGPIVDHERQDQDAEGREPPSLGLGSLKGGK